MKQNKSVSTQQIMQPKATLFSHLINKKVFFYVKVKNIVFSHFPEVTWEYCEPILLFGGQILFYLQRFLYQKNWNNQRSPQLPWQEYETFWAHFCIVLNIVQSLTFVEMSTKYSQIGKIVPYKFFIDIKSYPLGKTLTAKS